jgi:hypothetical protein
MGAGTLVVLVRRAGSFSPRLAGVPPENSGALVPQGPGRFIIDVAGYPDSNDEAGPARRFLVFFHAQPVRGPADRTATPRLDRTTST